MGRNPGQGTKQSGHEAPHPTLGGLSLSSALVAASVSSLHLEKPQNGPFLVAHGPHVIEKSPEAPDGVCIKTSPEVAFAASLTPG